MALPWCCSVPGCVETEARPPIRQSVAGCTLAPSWSCPSGRHWRRLPMPVCGSTTYLSLPVTSRGRTSTYKCSTQVSSDKVDQQRKTSGLFVKGDASVSPLVRRASNGIVLKVCARSSILLVNVVLYIIQCMYSRRSFESRFSLKRICISYIVQRIKQAQQ